ncbi:MAG: VOC family protein [Pararhodobacter sp.]
MTPVFHLAFHVDDLDAARAFYGGVLGCAEGRATASWVDFDFFGHQLSLHLGQATATTRTGRVGDTAVPMPHFGVVLDPDGFHALAARLQAGGVNFILPPQARFQGQPGEQWTMFVTDPAGNALEFKAYHRPEETFAR